MFPIIYFGKIGKFRFSDHLIKILQITNFLIKKYWQFDNTVMQTLLLTRSCRPTRRQDHADAAADEVMQANKTTGSCRRYSWRGHAGQHGNTIMQALLLTRSCRPTWRHDHAGAAADQVMQANMTTGSCRRCRWRGHAGQYWRASDADQDIIMSWCGQLSNKNIYPVFGVSFRRGSKVCSKKINPSYLSAII